MTDHDDLPAFDLPAWEPEVGSTEQEIEVIAETADPVTSTLPLAGFGVSGGIVHAVGDSDLDDPRQAVDAAAAAALRQLADAARRVGAAGVAGVRLEVVRRKSHTLVLGYGSAVSRRP